jgi:hypothetical protein
MPVPPPTEELIRLLSRYDLKVGELALELRSIVLSEASEAVETVFDTYALAILYSLTGKMRDGFCHIVLYTRHVNLGFNRGAELEDPKGLLIGSGKIMRHLKVESPADLKQRHFRDFIRAALRNAKAIAKERAVAKEKTTRTTKSASRSRKH